MQVGISYTILNLAFAIGSVVGGFMGDRFGRKPIIVLPTFAFVIFYLLASQTQNWQFLVGFLFVIWFGTGLQDPCFTSIIAESINERRRGTAFGIMQMAFSAGLVIGPFLGSFLVKRFNMAFLILITAIVSLVCAVIRAYGLKETKRRNSPELVIHTDREGLSRVLLNKNLVWMLIGGIFLWIVLCITVWGPFIALHAKDFVGLSKSEINLLFSIGSISAAIFSILTGKIIDKIGGKPIFIISVILHPLAFIPWLFTGNLVNGIPYFIFAYLFYQGVYIAYKVIISDLTSPANRARVFGVFGAITGMIGAFAPTFGMLTKIRFGPEAPFLMALAIGLVSAVCLLFVSYKTNHPNTT